MSIKSVAAAVLFVASAACHAAHITDKLVVGVYAKPTTDDKPLRLISSGTPIEVLAKKAGFTEVRLADETRGWVESRYVTEEKPAKAILLETQARLRQMGIEVARLREKAGEAPAAAGDAAAAGSAESAPNIDGTEALQARIADLKQQLAAAMGGHAEDDRYEAMRARSREALELLADAHGLRLDSAEPAEGTGWVVRLRAWLVGGAALVLGFVAGIAFIDWRIRRRYGGFRL